MKASCFIEDKRRYGTPQTKAHCRWAWLLRHDHVTVTIPLLPLFVRRWIAKRVSDSARY